MTARGLIVASSRSGSGKTTVTLGLLVAFRRHGVAVRAGKAGPDYIDTAFHAAAAGAASVNLDSWAMPRGLLNALAGEAAQTAELLIIEGVMGLFDGVAGPPGHSGTTADLAACLRLPVLLVLDVSGQSQTAAAVVRGLAGHDPDVRIAGVVLNRVGSERHRVLIGDAINALGIPVLGAVPRDAVLTMPERHLGLVQAGEHGDLAVRLDRLADMVQRHLDLDRIIASAAPLTVAGPSHRPALSPPGQRIAVAADAAFTFMYPHLCDGWRRSGAEIVAFSPLADEPPPHDCDACWLPGGYPELHAGVLANANHFQSGLRQFGETRPVHGECGGYMVLGQDLEDANGVRHAMVGLLGHATSFATRQLHLGYREVRLVADGALGRAGSTIRGHEFHYATLISRGTDERLLELSDAAGKPLGDAGNRRGHVTGAFFHAIAQV
ncbi:MAG TPA: cobyrinate a,c-diamide synthase [Xanthobacteraceae bacterium]|nr:cobyrinate a,c-diamide synthase [Xanthobacteraceae bacterium]